MNLAEFILILAITAYAVFVVVQKRKKKKRGCGCCGDCEGCAVPCGEKGKMRKQASEKG